MHYVILILAYINIYLTKIVTVLKSFVVGFFSIIRMLKIMLCSMSSTRHYYIYYNIHFQLTTCYLLLRKLSTPNFFHIFISHIYAAFLLLCKPFKPYICHFANSYLLLRNLLQTIVIFLCFEILLRAVGNLLRFALSFLLANILLVRSLSGEGHYKFERYVWILQFKSRHFINYQLLKCNALLIYILNESFLSSINSVILNCYVIIILIITRYFLEEIKTFFIKFVSRAKRELRAASVPCFSRYDDIIEPLCYLKNHYFLDILTCALQCRNMHYLIMILLCFSLWISST